MQPKTLFAVVAPLVAASAVRAAAFPQETGVAAMKRGNPLDDLNSVIDEGVGKATSAVDGALHWGSSVLENGATVLTNEAGKALTLASKGAEGLVTTIEGKIYTVVTDNLSPSQTAKPDNAAASVHLSPLLAIALSAMAGVAMV